MNRLAMTCICALTMAGFCQRSSAEERVLFQDAFNDQNGNMIRQTDGKDTRSGPRATRNVFPFMGLSKQATLPLTIEALEDHKRLGPDDQPGVLAITYREVPESVVYSGVAYLGPRNRPIAHESLSTIQADNLKSLKVRFHYRAANDMNKVDVGASFVCRLEPRLADSYRKRIHLGQLHATAEWQLFETTLDRGQNQEAFLSAMTDEKPMSFKIIWAQGGAVNEYQPGDTLLIDNLAIIQIAE